MSVFHLKYRPHNWAEMDSVEAAEKIKKYVINGSETGAFLFAGPKGSGKTSAARILAKAINCTSLENGEPCGKCEACKSIDKGGGVDIMEIDAASNRGIEDVRTIKEKAFLMPAFLNKKVFIVDEAHMMTKEAFNAFLKLLEEPPKHTVFIMCTTDPQKIPETVLSRLVRIDFTKGKSDELKKALTRIIEGEELSVDDKVVEELIKRSDGSFRNLHRMFNEMVEMVGKVVTWENASKYLSNNNEYNLEELSEDILAHDLKKIIDRWEQLAASSWDFAGYRERLIGYYQNKLVEMIGGKSPDIKLWSRWLNILIAAGKQERDCPVAQLPLELGIIELLSETGNQNIELSTKTEIKEVKVEIQPNNQAEALTVITEEKVTLSEQSSEIGEVINEGSIGSDDLEKKWGTLLVNVKPYNHSVEAFLRAARPKGVKNGELLIEVFYPFHKDKLEEAKNRKIVEEGISKTYGSNWSFRCMLSNGKKPALVINNETPMEKISEELAEGDKKDIYEVAKEIFG